MAASADGSRDNLIVPRAAAYVAILCHVAEIQSGDPRPKAETISLITDDDDEAAGYAACVNKEAAMMMVDPDLFDDGSEAAIEFGLIDVDQAEAVKKRLGCVKR